MNRKEAIKLIGLSAIGLCCKKNNMPNPVINKKITLGGNTVKYLPEANALFAQMSVQPTLHQKDCYNVLIESLISILGSWNTKNLLQIYGLQDSQSSTLNIFNPGTNTATFNGGILHQPFFGVRGDMSTAYVNTSYNPSVAAGPFTSTDGEHMVFVNYPDSSTNTQWVAGQANLAGDSNAIRVKLQNGLSSYNGNVNGGTNYVDGGSGVGMYACKITPGNNTLKINGVTIVTTAKTLTAVPSANDYVLGFNDNGSLYQPTGGHIYARMWCNGLSDAQSTAIVNSLNTFRLNMVSDYSFQGPDKYALFHIGQSNATQFISIDQLHPLLQTNYTNSFNKDVSGNTSIYRPGYHAQASDNGSFTNTMGAGNTCVWKLSQHYGKTVYNYNYAIGGSAIYAGANQWNISDAVYYTTVLTAINSLIATTGTAKYWIWISQWNADADGGAHAAAWEQNWTDNIAGWRSATGLGNNLYIGIERPHSLSAPNYPAGSIAAFNGYIDNMVANITNCYAIDTTPVDMRTDLNHYSSIGEMDLGYRMADLMFSKLG